VTKFSSACSQFFRDSRTNLLRCGCRVGSHARQAGARPAISAYVFRRTLTVYLTVSIVVGTRTGATIQTYG
jgi:hypothetical protein